jgi:hypothetical protein
MPVGEPDLNLLFGAATAGELTDAIVASLRRENGHT